MHRVRPLFSGVLVAAASLAVSSTASGAIFTLAPGSADFPTITAVGPTSQATVTSLPEDGIALTVAVAGGNAGGVSNSNDFGGGYGVTGNGSFDINASESMTLSFNQDVYLEQLSFNGFNETEAANIAIGSLSIAINLAGNETITPGVTGITASRGGANDIVLNFAAETFSLSAGDTVVISNASGSQFLVDGVTVSAVPEPGSMALLALGATFIIRRKR